MIYRSSHYLAGTTLNLTSGKPNLYLVKYALSESGIPGFLLIYTMLTLFVPPVGALLLRHKNRYYY
jgi:hypothetical protein